MMVIVILYLCISIAFSSTNIVFADCAGVGTSVVNCTSKDGSAAIQEVLWNTLDIFSAIVGILGIAGITIVGVQYIRAGGNEQQTTKAKRRMLEIIIGLGVYAVAFGGLKWLNVSPLKSVEMESISIANNNVTVAKGSKVDLKPTIYPLNADAKVTCKILSGKKIASVNTKTCVVTPKKNGKTGTVKVEITAKQGDKEIAKTVTVKVTKAEEKKADDNSNNNVNGNDPFTDTSDRKKFGYGLAALHAGGDNEIADVKKAVKDKAYAVECDLQYRNGAFYCHHYDKGQSFNNGWTKFSDYIKEVNGTGTRIILDMNKNSDQFSDTALKKLASILKDNPKMYISQMNSVSKVSKLSSYVPGLEFWGLEGSVDSILKNASKLKKAGMTAINTYGDKLNQSKISKIRKAGLDVAVYDFNTSKSKVTNYTKYGNDIKYIMRYPSVW